MNVKTTLAAIAGCAMLAVAGYAKSPPLTSASPAPVPPAAASTQLLAANLITIQNFRFTPSSLTVKPRATVTVTNKASVDHTVTADSGNAFNIRVAAGTAATFTAPTNAGTYAYHCSIHPFMHGTLVVSG